MRRNNHYQDLSIQPYFIVAAFGTALVALGIISILIQLYVSIRDRNSARDLTGDPWNGRTLEWTVSSPAPFYNFAVLPQVNELDQFWVDKQNHKKSTHPMAMHYEPIHMPRNTAAGFIIAMCAGVLGFALIWQMWIPGVMGFAGIVITLVAKSFNTDTDYYVDVETVKQMELAHLKGAN